MDELVSSLFTHKDSEPLFLENTQGHQYYDCTLLKDWGPFKAGLLLHCIYVNFDELQLEVYKVGSIQPIYIHKLTLVI